MAKEIRIPSCLGQMAQWYCEYCSTECPLAALCSLLVMGDHLRKDSEVPPFKDLTEQDYQ
ncbi:MAG: hypothetical protein V3R87_07470 [Dehalococcoidia bacterium]